MARLVKLSEGRDCSPLRSAEYSAAQSPREAKIIEQRYSVVRLSMLAHCEYAGVITIVRSETLIRWYRTGSRAWLHWKSRSQGCRPNVGHELRLLIRRMCEDNPLCGVPQIHGVLLKLNFTVGGTT